MKFHVLTTMNKTGWEETGRRMVESFLERWPEEARPLTVYAEDFEPDLPVEVRKLPVWMSQFKADYGSSLIGNGHRNGGYNYVFDAVKFAHKVAAITDFGSLSTSMSGSTPYPSMIYSPFAFVRADWGTET